YSAAVVRRKAGLSGKPPSSAPALENSDAWAPKVATSASGRIINRKLTLIIPTHRNRLVAAAQRFDEIGDIASTALDVGRFGWPNEGRFRRYCFMKTGAGMIGRLIAATALGVVASVTGALATEAAPAVEPAPSCDFFQAELIGVLC